MTHAATHIARAATLLLGLLLASPAAAIHWGAFQADHCTSTSTRQYSAILWDIPWGWSWEQTCEQTPATIEGYYFASPRDCENTGLNMWGEWDVPDPSCSSFVHPAPDGCYAVWANATNRFLSHNGTAFYLANRANVGAWERFRLVGTGANRYLVYGSDDQYMSSNGSGGVGKAVKPQLWEQWELVPLGGLDYAVRSVAHGRHLSADGVFSTVLTQPWLDSWEIFRFKAATGCAVVPDADVATDATPQPQTPGEPLRGIADTHSHMFAHLGFGGDFFSGQPYHPWGLDAAVGWCTDSHGAEGVLDLLGNLMDDQASHHVGGSPQFDGWPRADDANHQQMYWKWLERAWRGGLRLQVLLAVNNETLCGASNGFLSCDDMEAVDRQLAAARAFEAYLDAKSGGPGQGWFRIVESPQEARQVIEAGKLAIVLGVEVDSLFGCKTGSCTPQQVDAKLDQYLAEGVRHVFPVHANDNAFGHASVQSAFFNVSNHDANGSFYAVEACPVDFDANVGFLDGLAGFLLTGQVPGYPGNNHCNAGGLTPLGEHLLGGMMDRAMIIDVDHMSARMIDATLDLAEQRGYPVVSGHTGFRSLSTGQKMSEGQKTPEQILRIRDLGGLVAPILHQGKVEGSDAGEGGILAHGSAVANDCDESSKVWAQAYLYAVDQMAGGPGVHGVPLGSDLNGLIHQPAPRFGPDACAHNAGQAAGQASPVPYPFPAHEGPGSFWKMTSGDRTFDYNTDGLAHIGLLPDFVQDLKQAGLSDADLDPLFDSAEAYVQMWERAAAAPDADGDLVSDAADNCPGAANPLQTDSDADGIGNACDCDFNGDGICGGSDYVQFLGCFARPATGACAHVDMVVDGIVGSSDLLAFLAGFGGTPGW